MGIINDKLYVAGGRRTSGVVNKYLDFTEAAVDVYDFTSNQWQSLDENLNIPTERAGSPVVVKDQLLVVMGGESIAQEAAHSEVEAFDTEHMKWIRLPDLVRGRHGTGATIVNGKIYIAAGCGNRGGSPELNSIEVYK